MGAAPSSRTVSEMSLSAKLSESNKTESSIDCESMAENVISINQVGGANCRQAAHISGVTQANTALCDATASMVSLSDQKASQDLQQLLTQTAEASVKGINPGASPEATAISNTNLSSELDLSNTTAQSCMADAYGLNAVFVNQVAGANCDQVAEIEDINQDNKISASTDCNLQSENRQTGAQRITQSVSQSASAKTEGAEWVLVAMYAIYSFSSVVSFAIAAKYLGWIAMAIVIILLLVMTTYFVYSTYTTSDIVNNTSPMELYSETSDKYDIPWYIRWGLDTDDDIIPKFYEQLKVADSSHSDGDGVFIVKYSSIDHIKQSDWDSITDATLKEDLIKKKGLMNPDLYGDLAKDNEGDTDPLFTSSSISSSATRKGAWPQPDDAMDFMNKPENYNKYYAFEIIKYVAVVDTASEVILTKLDSPITIFYTKLNPKFWNYDLIKEDKCLIANCGIPDAKFEKEGGKTKECTKDTDCNADHFCGAGGIGCIACDYCKTNEDGYAGKKESPEGCLTKCSATTTPTSLLEVLEPCKKCYGLILQQSETGHEKNTNIPTKGDNSWNKPDYKQYINNTEIYSPDKYEILGNINFDETDSKFKSYGESGHWTTIDSSYIGFSESSFSDITNDNIEYTSTGTAADKYYISYDNNSSWDNNKLTLANNGSTLVEEEKCSFTPITYPVDDGEPDYHRPAQGTKEKLTTTDGLWSNHTSGGSCYNIGENKCVDKYQATCNNFMKELGHVECDGAGVVDNFKTLEDDAICGPLSMSDNITEENWATCKSTCCAIPTSAAARAAEFAAPGGTIAILDASVPTLTSDQGICIHTPAGSINIPNERYLPHEANTIGIKMFRDNSIMGSQKSLVDLVNDDYLYSIGLLVVIGIIGGLIAINQYKSHKTKAMAKSP